MGSGLRPRRHARREDPRAGASRDRRGQGVGAEGASTPGSGGSAGPTEYGGRGLPGCLRPAPTASSRPSTRSRRQSPFGIGLGMVAPTILAHAIPDGAGALPAPPVSRRHHRLPAVLRARRRLRPGRDPDPRRARRRRVGLTGQKVWTSGAQYSDIGEIITRTSPDKPKHKGLTMFLVDMHAPGVEVRPLRQMTGGASFNEVFFDERARPRLAPARRRRRWVVGRADHADERAGVDRRRVAPGPRTRARAGSWSWPGTSGASADPVIRQRLADLYIRSHVARYTNQRAMAKVRAGQAARARRCRSPSSPSPRTCGRRPSSSAEILGPRLAADSGEWGTYAWSELVLGVPGMRIAGGTDEVMRNIVGERVLGLPKEPRLDRV